MAASLLTGCAVGPDPATPSAAALGVPDRYTTEIAAPDTPGDLSRWWERFDDPELTRLVEQATARNLDIAQAVARLVQAREAAVIAGADLLPSLSGSGGITRSISSSGSGGIVNDGTGTPIIVDRGGDSRTSLSLRGDASYEVDIFGGTRRSIQAARADLADAGFDLASVRVSTAAEVANSYVQLRAAQARLAVAQDTLATLDENLRIARWRVQAGLVSSLDAEQARAQRAQTAASLPQLQTSIANARNRLSVLTGEAPGALAAQLDATASIPVGPDALTVGIPADTLRQRPDVRRSEQALLAATARIGVARAQLFPALRLTGNIGTTAASIGGLGDIVTGALFAGLTQTLFDGGRLRAQLRSQRAAADAAAAAYRQTVLTGLEDVENSLIALVSARSREVELTTAFDASNNAAILARSQYRAGLTDFQTLLDAERTLLSARDGLTQARADRSLALVQLYRALGGGWEAAANGAEIGSAS